MEQKILLAHRIAAAVGVPVLISDLLQLELEAFTLFRCHRRLSVIDIGDLIMRVRDVEPPYTPLKRLLLTITRGILASILEHSARRHPFLSLVTLRIMLVVALLLLILALLLE